MMIPHGPSANVFEGASKSELKPERVAENTMVGYNVSFFSLINA